MSADSTFFYANLKPTNRALANERGFIFGGQAVPATSPLLTTAPGIATLHTFILQQDAALQSPIPFITQSTGGNIPGATVSPYYVIAPASAAFGAYNPTTNPNAIGTRSLQASLAINGAGSAQTSALVVQTGSFLLRATATRWPATASCAARTRQRRWREPRRRRYGSGRVRRPFPTAARPATTSLGPAPDRRRSAAWCWIKTSTIKL